MAKREKKCNPNQYFFHRTLAEHDIYLSQSRESTTENRHKSSVINDSVCSNTATSRPFLVRTIKTDGTVIGRLRSEWPSWAYGAQLSIQLYFECICLLTRETDVPVTFVSVPPPTAVGTSIKRRYDTSTVIY